MAISPFGWTYYPLLPPPPASAYLSPKDVARCDIMKLQVSWQVLQSFLVKGLTATVVGVNVKLAMSAGTSTQNSLFTFQPTETNMYSTILCSYFLALSIAQCYQCLHWSLLHPRNNDLLSYPRQPHKLSESELNTHLRHRLPRDA